MTDERFAPDAPTGHVERSDTETVLLSWCEFVHPLSEHRALAEHGYRVRLDDALQPDLGRPLHHVVLNIVLTDRLVVELLPAHENEAFLAADAELERLFPSPDHPRRSDVAEKSRRDEERYISRGNGSLIDWDVLFG